MSDNWLKKSHQVDIRTGIKVLIHSYLTSPSTCS